VRSSPHGSCGSEMILLLYLNLQNFFSMVTLCTGTWESFRPGVKLIQGPKNPAKGFTVSRSTAYSGFWSRDPSAKVTRKSTLCEISGRISLQNCRPYWLFLS